MFVITAYELDGKPLAAFRRRRRKKHENRRPEGWDEGRVLRVMAHYEKQTEDEALLEDEAGVQLSDTVMNVPRELVAEIRELIAKRHR